MDEWGHERCDGWYKKKEKKNTVSETGARSVETPFQAKGRRTRVQVKARKEVTTSHGKVSS